jgi:hypothetical protein
MITEVAHRSRHKLEIIGQQIFSSSRKLEHQKLKR